MQLNIEFLENSRKIHGENIRVFAKRLGVSHQTYYNYFIHPDRITLKQINKIAKNLKLNPISLVRI